MLCTASDDGSESFDNFTRRSCSSISGATLGNKSDSRRWKILPVASAK